jgi:hypothetical protein
VAVALRLVHKAILGRERIFEPRTHTTRRMTGR